MIQGSEGREQGGGGIIDDDYDCDYDYGRMDQRPNTTPTPTRKPGRGW